MKELNRFPGDLG